MKHRDSHSIAEILALLYLEVLRHHPDNPAWPERDRFVLCKPSGWPAHASLLFRLGYPVRPEDFSADMNAAAGVDFSSATVGAGLSAAVGMALSLRSAERSSRVFALMDSSDLHAGRVWEAAEMAGRQKLGRLCVVVEKCRPSQAEPAASKSPDNHGSMTKEILETFRAFGWDGLITGGHALDELRYAFSKLPKSSSSRPFVIVAETRLAEADKFEKGSAVEIAFEKHLCALASQYPFLVYMRNFTEGLEAGRRFAELFPNRFFQMPFSSSNWIELACGMACAGKVPVIEAEPRDFAGRFWEDIRSAAAHAKKNLTLVARPPVFHDANLKMPDDLALMRMIPGSGIYAPAAEREMAGVLAHCVTHHSLCYVRLPSFFPAPGIPGDGFSFIPGRWIRLRDGDEMAIIACGETTAAALRAADALSSKGIGAAVFHAGSITPFDKKILIEIARKFRNLVTCEQHLPAGGLGGLVSETIARQGISTRLLQIGVPVCDTPSELNPSDAQVQMILRAIRQWTRPPGKVRKK